MQNIAIFGLKLDDMKFLKKDNKGNKLFTSKLLADCWKFGFHSIGYISEYTCLYTAHYMQKFYPIPNDLVRPFYLMSTHPGIGANYFDENKHILESDKVYVHGKYIKVPRYYLKLAERQGIDISDLKEARIENNGELSIRDFITIDRDRLGQKIRHDLLGSV